MQLKQMNITDLNVRYREEHVCISILIQKDVVLEKVRMLGILKIWKNNGTFQAMLLCNIAVRCIKCRKYTCRNGSHHKTFAADFYICRAYGKRVNK